MKHLPTNFDVSLALADVLRAADVHYAVGSVRVSSVNNVGKRLYRLVPWRSVSDPLSQVLAGVLHRPFVADEGEGWTIDAREARTLISTFGR